jgi:hypothetical protein
VSCGRIGLHTGGDVEQDDDLAVGGERGGHGGPRQGQRERRQDEELEEEEPVVAQFLPGTVGAAVGQGATPEEGAGDDHVAAAQPQHVEQQDGEREEQGREAGGGKQVDHKRTQIHADERR